MTVGKTNGINPLISNISFYNGSVPKIQFKKSYENTITGNPNRPVCYNNDENAGALRGLGVYYLA